MYSIQKKSIAWRYFENKNSLYAECTICNTKVKHCGGTTNLISHLSRKHELLCPGIINKKRIYTFESSGESTPEDDPPLKQTKIVKVITTAFTGIDKHIILLFISITF